MCCHLELSNKFYGGLKHRKNLIESITIKSAFVFYTRALDLSFSLKVETLYRMTTTIGRCS